MVLQDRCTCNSIFSIVPLVLEFQQSIYRYLPEESLVVTEQHASDSQEWDTTKLQNYTISEGCNHSLFASFSQGFSIFHCFVGLFILCRHCCSVFMFSWYSSHMIHTIIILWLNADLMNKYYQNFCETKLVWGSRKEYENKESSLQFAKRRGEILTRILKVKIEEIRNLK